MSILGSFVITAAGRSQARGSAKIRSLPAPGADSPVEVRFPESILTFSEFGYGSLGGYPDE